MKKIYTYLLMALFATPILTSCETSDEVIADYLTSGDWEGYLGAYVQNRWGDTFADGEYRTVFHFDAAGYDRDGYTATWGTGYEADYDPYYSYDYAYSAFRWEVRGGDIYITYDDPRWQPVRIDYTDYTLTSTRFRGTMYDWADRIYDFDLQNTRFNWNRYRSSYYVRTRSAQDADNEAADVPVINTGSSILSGKFATAAQQMAHE